MNRTCLYCQPPSFTILQPVLSSNPTEGRGLSWPGWLFNRFLLFSEPLGLTDTGFFSFCMPAALSDTQPAVKNADG